MRTSTDIIIVNWNSGAQLQTAVTSAAQHEERQVKRVIVVDNASDDNSLAGLRQMMSDELPFELVIVQNRENRGFAAACNQGAQYSDSEFLLFLNPDTELYPGSLSVPVSFLIDPVNEGVGIVGIQLVDERGNLTRSCSRLPTLTGFMAHAVGLVRVPQLRHLGPKMEEWAHDTTRPVDQVIGAFFLMRHSLFDALGGFDERFFVYFEEVDLCLRARRSGYSSVYLAEARAMHVGGVSSRQITAGRLYYSLRSRLRYAGKHFSRPSVILLHIVTWLVEPWTRMAHALLRRDIDAVRSTISAYTRLISEVAQSDDRGPRW